MATIVIATSTTVTSGFTASTLPASAPGGSARTMANTDQALTYLRDEVNRIVKDLFQGVNVPASGVVTTITVT